MFIRLAAVLLVSVIALAPSAEAQYKARRAPGFSLPDVNMKQHDLQDYRGKVVIVNIMRTTCPVCSQFSRNLGEIENRFDGRVKVLNVVNPPDNQAMVRKYLSENSLDTTMLFDCGQVSASYLQVTPDRQTMSVKIPHYFVVDPNGRIREDYGYNDLTKGNFEVDVLHKIVEKYAPSANVAD